METTEMLKPLVKIERRVLDRDLLEETCINEDNSNDKTGIWQQLKKGLTKQKGTIACSLKKLLTGMFPILIWLPKYSWKDNFFSDCVSGTTVAVMQIPQGMGFALLANVPPVVGIYTAVFPALVYILLGTSHHLSLGTLSIVTLMTGKVVDQYGSPARNTNLSDFTNETIDSDYPTNLEIATLVCFLVGAWQIIMGMFHLGVVGLVLSEHLISGFTTGIAVHVLGSQMKNLFGIQVSSFNGPFRLIRNTYLVLMALSSSNPAEIILSFITMFCLVVHNDWIKPWYNKKMKFSLPIELLAIVIGTVSSYYGNFNEKYDVNILGPVPAGFPTPRIPTFSLIFDVLFDSFIIALVIYAVSLSMAKTFSQKCNYLIENNQELLALGAANFVGSFFSCVPVSASPSRSLLQFATGGKSQIASFISCALLTIVLLWIGPVFKLLPLSVLSAVIIVTLKGLFMQFKVMRKLLKTSRLDAVVWIITCFATILIDFDIGVGLGVIASISVLFYRSHRPHVVILGRLPETELYVDTSMYRSSVEELGMKIFRWIGPINFTNGEVFQKELVSHLPSSPKRTTLSTTNCQENQHEPSSNHILPEEQLFVMIEDFICDFSAVSYIDLVGSNMLKSVHADLKAKHIKLSLVVCSDHLIHQLGGYGFFKDFSKTRVYPSVMDAVVSIKSGLGVDNSRFGSSTIKSYFHII